MKSGVPAYGYDWFNFWKMFLLHKAKIQPTKPVKPETTFLKTYAFV
jgi:hypothetical protein